ncbi:MAG: PilZ domain-containing protein [Deltaproteobacteria bacterium]|nr:PilZ domain-containing protein [Deltaproteobacteria bacterium]
MVLVSDTRKFSRLNFDSDSFLVEAKTGKRHDTHLIDISLQGALVERPTFWQEEKGQNCRLEVQLADSPIVVSMECEVVHWEKNHLGLHLVSIDLESMTHLRRLLELNLGDPSIMTRELLESE